MVRRRRSADHGHAHERDYRGSATDLCGAVHPEARHRIARRLRVAAPARRCARGADRGHRGAAVVDGDRHRLGRRAGAGVVRRDHRRVHGLGARRQPFPDRRPGRRVHRPRGGHRAGARSRRVAARDDAVRAHARGDRPPQARHLHQVHSLSRDRRIHGRDRRHHPRESAQGSLRALARRAGTRRADRQAAGSLARSADVRRHHDRGVVRDDRRHRRPETLAAAMARHVDRGRGRRCRHGGRRARCHDDRLPFRRHSKQPAVAVAARRRLGQGARGAAERGRVRAARRHRVTVVGCRRRRHDGPQASLELRARRSGCRPMSLRACSAASA